MKATKEKMPWSSKFGFGTGPMEGMFCVRVNRSAKKLSHGVVWAHLEPAKLLVRWFSAFDGEQVFFTVENSLSSDDGWCFFATIDECIRCYECEAKMMESRGEP